MITAAPVGPCKLPKPLVRDPLDVRLEKPLPVSPDEPLLCGEYGPRFIGYGPEPEPSLTQRAVPWMLGAAIGLTALAIEYLMGAL
jgi:hypothetical protein